MPAWKAVTPRGATRKYYAESRSSTAIKGDTLGDTGGAGGYRTHGLRIASAALSHLSYNPVVLVKAAGLEPAASRFQAGHSAN